MFAEEKRMLGEEAEMLARLQEMPPKSERMFVGCQRMLARGKGMLESSTRTASIPRGLVRTEVGPSPAPGVPQGSN